MGIMLLMVVALQVAVLGFSLKILRALRSKDKFSEIINNSTRVCIITDPQIIDILLHGNRIYCSKILKSDKVFFKSK